MIVAAIWPSAGVTAWSEGIVSTTMPSDNPKEPLEKQRGLLIHSDYIGRFLDPFNPKTAEVRNFACRVLKSNNEFYLVESGLKDSNRRGVWRIWAKAMFTGNTFDPRKSWETLLSTSFDTEGIWFPQQQMLHGQRWIHHVGSEDHRDNGQDADVCCCEGWWGLSWIVYFMICCSTCSKKKVRLLQFLLLLWIFKGAIESLHLGFGSLLVEFRLARESSPKNV